MILKVLTINVCRDFSRILGGRERQISEFSGEEFREQFLDNNFEVYDKITIELDGPLGYPVDFLDETFGVMARRYGPKAFWEKFKFVSRNTNVTERITYMVNHSQKESP